MPVFQWVFSSNWIVEGLLESAENAQKMQAEWIHSHLSIVLVVVVLPHQTKLVLPLAVEAGSRQREPVEVGWE